MSLAERQINQKEINKVGHRQTTGLLGCMTGALRTQCMDVRKHPELSSLPPQMHGEESKGIQRIQNFHPKAAQAGMVRCVCVFVVVVVVVVVVLCVSTALPLLLLRLILTHWLSLGLCLCPLWPQDWMGTSTATNKVGGQHPHQQLVQGWGSGTSRL